VFRGARALSAALEAERAAKTVFDLAHERMQRG
jgi:hypothetical protein